MSNCISQSPARPNPAAAVLGGLHFRFRALCRRSLCNRAVYLCLSGRGLLPTMLLFASVLIGATATQGQELALSDATSGVCPSNGWRSPEAAESLGARRPQLRLNPSSTEAFDSRLSAEPMPVTSPPLNAHAGADYTSANLFSALGSYPESPKLASMLNRSSEEIRFFRYPLEDEHLLWQSRLMDSETLTAERGVLVYPLAQLNLIETRVPISLYMPGLRGSAPNTAW